MIELAVFSLQYGKCMDFNAFRFLHERLLGGRLPPYLPSVFAAAMLAGMVIFELLEQGMPAGKPARAKRSHPR